MEAINALHNKLQSLEEELSNAQQHSHHIDEEVNTNYSLNYLSIWFMVYVVDYRLQKYGKKEKRN